MDSWTVVWNQAINWSCFFGISKFHWWGATATELKDCTVSFLVMLRTFLLMSPCFDCQEMSRMTQTPSITREEFHPWDRWLLHKTCPGTLWRRSLFGLRLVDDSTIPIGWLAGLLPRKLGKWPNLTSIVFKWALQPAKKILRTWQSSGVSLWTSTWCFSLLNSDTSYDKSNFPWGVAVKNPDSRWVNNLLILIFRESVRLVSKLHGLRWFFQCFRQKMGGWSPGNDPPFPYQKKH